jgi:hypothetical protein
MILFGVLIIDTAIIRSRSYRNISENIDKVFVQTIGSR